MVADGRSNPKNWLGPLADCDNGWLALRAAERPSYLASALAEYLEVRAWSPLQLAHWLGCAPNQLAKLALCRRPDPAGPDFLLQVGQIVITFQLDYWQLRRLLEELALSTEQRQQLWQVENPLEDVRPAPRTEAASGEFTALFDKTSEHPALGRLESAPSRSAQHRMAFPESAKVPGGLPISMAKRTAPEGAASSPPKSWLGRLLTAIGRIFSPK
jgi:hypothetical protein